MSSLAYGGIIQTQDDTHLMSELDLYEKGKRLHRVVNSPDWELIVQILEDYRDKAVADLVHLLPGDPHVVCSHAAASCATQIVENFQNDVNSAVQSATKPSQELIKYLNGVREASDVSRAMGQGD